VEPPCLPTAVRATALDQHSLRAQHHSPAPDPAGQRPETAAGPGAGPGGGVRVSDPGGPKRARDSRRVETVADYTSPLG